MHLGIFAKTFERRPVEAVLDVVALHGLDSIQFNFSIVDPASLPDEIDPRLAERVRRAAGERGIAIAAVSGTFNMVHPDVMVRRDGLRRLRTLAASCRALGTEVVTLCTGTRDPNDMWRSHHANKAHDAWQDLIVSMREAVAIARANGISVAIEPETANVIDSALKAKRLLDEIEADELKIVLDPANLVERDQLSRMPEILDEAFALLGEQIVLAHAKDISPNGDAAFVPAGTGMLDYDHYLRLLAKVGFDGSLVLHSLREQDVAASVGFLRERLRRLPELVDS